MPEENKTIWTIGHSTRSLEELLTMLRSFNIEIVADVRHFPGSRKYPHFNKESMEVTLPRNNIQYFHFKKNSGFSSESNSQKCIIPHYVSARSVPTYLPTEGYAKSVLILHVP